MRRQQTEYVVIGKIVKAHGLKGEVKVKPLTDNPKRFKRLSSVIIERNRGELEELEISRAVVQAHEVYLSFKDIRNREKAQNLRGAFICIKREDILPLEKGRFYHFEVIGFEVITVSGKSLGFVEEFMDLPANDVLVCRKNEKEFLIPVIKDVIVDIDKEAGKVIIQPMEGLFD